MLNEKQKEVNAKKFAYVEARDNGFVWFNEDNGDFMLQCKAKDKVDLSDMR
jgi:hypothetical protein